MTSSELRKGFLDFFEERGHKIVPSSSILPIDPSVLFTTAGMQQFKPYYLGEKSPYGPNTASCQKCIRTSDIDEVGDKSHLTFLEMLGNFSFGGYFKKEAIKLAFEFLFEKLKLSKEAVIFTVFEGDKDVPVDKESILILKEMGVPEGKIKKYSRKDNFWGPTGQEGPCGPTVEIHFENIEVWNLVFNEYYQDRNKKLTLLPQKGVDTGMGLERLAMTCQEKSSVFETDLFESIVKEIEKKAAKPYTLNPESYRIIADHSKSVVFIASEGIFPSNIEKGYVLRKILRRAIRQGKFLQLPKNFLIPLVEVVIDIYKEVYPELKSRQADIMTVIQKEEEKFGKTLEKGLKEFEKIKPIRGVIGGEDAFHLYDTHSVPLELTEELAREKGLKEDKQGFEEFFKKHREISRAGVEKKFGGVGKEATYEAAKFHTATHLLHAALREILGTHVKQMGSDITFKRLRFDFSHSQKMTKEEIKKVEDLVNQKIKEDLSVKKEEMFLKDALQSGALAFFKEKYPERVSVYIIDSFSKEICAGPHAKRTGELGHFKITKEESAGSGIRRIRAILE